MKHLYAALSVVASLGWATATANAQSWMEVQKLHAGHGAADDEFAQTASVSISADRAIVSAFWDDDDGSDPASAYVFERNGMGTWNLVSRLVTGDAPSDNVYGQSVDVSISGDAAILGVSFNDDNGEQAGSAYVFERDVTGIWNQVAKLLASDGEAVDQFGRSVSISGNRAIVGTPSDDDNGGGFRIRLCVRAGRDGRLERGRQIARQRRGFHGYVRPLGLYLRRSGDRRGSWR